jgi:hypothetical protein
VTAITICKAAHTQTWQEVLERNLKEAQTHTAQSEHDTYLLSSALWESYFLLHIHEFLFGRKQCLSIVSSLQNILLDGYGENHRMLIQNQLYLSAECHFLQFEDNILITSVENVSFKQFGDLK